MCCIEAEGLPILQESQQKGSTAWMPSCPCPSCVTSRVPRTVRSAPGRPGPHARIPALGKPQRVGRPGRDPYWLTMLGKVSKAPPAVQTFYSSCILNLLFLDFTFISLQFVSFITSLHPLSLISSQIFL